MADDYVIDGARATHETGPLGGLVDVMEVSFHTVPEEATGHVRVPLKSGWRQAAGPLIEEQVAEMRALFQA